MSSEIFTSHFVVFVYRILSSLHILCLHLTFCSFNFLVSTFWVYNIWCNVQSVNITVLMSFPFKAKTDWLYFDCVFSLSWDNFFFLLLSMPDNFLLLLNLRDYHLFGCWVILYLYNFSCTLCWDSFKLLQGQLTFSLIILKFIISW